MLNLYHFLICFPVLAASAINLSDPISLAELWDDEQLYYQPTKQFDQAMEFNGLAYITSTQSCYRLAQKKGAKKVDSKKIECSKEFLQKASEPYDKISDFKSYKKKLVGCLTTQDKKCLRGLISKTMKTSFGGEGLYDRRDYVFSQWKKTDYEKLGELIKKGVVSEGDFKRFPPHPASDGIGRRGHFEMKNGSWVLESFVEGD